MSIETRLSLLARIRDHSDGAAWRDFVAIYEPVIYRHARSRGLQDADAREVTQEVLMSVAASIERFDPERETRFGSWLSRVARNAAIDRIRRRHERGSGRTDLIRTLEQQPERDQDESTRFDLDRRRELFRWAAGRARGRLPRDDLEGVLPDRHRRAIRGVGGEGTEDPRRGGLRRPLPGAGAAAGTGRRTGRVGGMSEWAE